MSICINTTRPLKPHDDVGARRVGAKADPPDDVATVRVVSIASILLRMRLHLPPPRRACRVCTHHTSARAEK